MKTVYMADGENAYSNRTSDGFFEQQNVENCERFNKRIAFPNGV